MVQNDIGTLRTMKRIALATLASLILTACAVIPAAPTDAAPSGSPLA